MACLMLLLDIKKTKCIVMQVKLKVGRAEILLTMVMAKEHPDSIFSAPVVSAK